MINNPRGLGRFAVLEERFFGCLKGLSPPQGHDAKSNHSSNPAQLQKICYPIKVTKTLYESHNARKRTQCTLTHFSNPAGEVFQLRIGPQREELSRMHALQPCHLQPMHCWMRTYQIHHGTHYALPGYAAHWHHCI
jgi:hypothetical protein